MKGEMKNRVALLSILLIVGLLIASIGTALGAGKVFQGIGKEVKAVMMGNQVTISEDGKVVKEFTLSDEEGYNYTWEISGHKLVIHKITKEEMEKKQAEHEAKMNKWLEIANNDSRVQELTNGKGIEYKGEDYNVVGAASSEDEVILSVNIEGKYYKITIDLNSETVKSVEEQGSGVIGTCYGPEGPIDCSKLPLRGLHAPR